MTGDKTWRCRLLRWSVCRRSDKGATRCVDAWLPYDPRPNPINSLLGCLLNTEPKKCFISGRLSNSILLIYAKTYPNPCQRCTQHNNSELIFISQGPNRRKYKWKNRSENMPIPCPPCPPANRSIVPSILSACHLPVCVNKWPVFHPLKSAVCHSTQKQYIRFAQGSLDITHISWIQSIQGVQLYTLIDAITEWIRIPFKNSCTGPWTNFCPYKLCSDACNYFTRGRSSFDSGVISPIPFVSSPRYPTEGFLPQMQNNTIQVLQSSAKPWASTS